VGGNKEKRVKYKKDFVIFLNLLFLQFTFFNKKLTNKVMLGYGICI